MIEKLQNIPPQYLYPGMVVAILTMSVVAHVVLITKASSDGGAQVIPDYYQKSLDWDAEQARAAAERDNRSVKSKPVVATGESTE